VNTNWITLVIIATGLLAAIGGGLRDAYLDFQAARRYEALKKQCEGHRLIRIVPTPYDWQTER
jgi:hypothetical protein